MLFWRKKNKNARQEREEAEDKIIHNPNDPAIELPVEYDSDIDPEFEKHELNETENEVIDELEEIPYAKSSPTSVSKKEDLGGGWLSR
ncbi:MAG TPA: hypothetical protein PLK94_14950, partial [Alphaproteobacteria bacterium]|nr:hypothetical protein [Alphaproteobacteria bacterium]